MDASSDSSSDNEPLIKKVRSVSKSDSDENEPLSKLIREDCNPPQSLLPLFSEVDNWSDDTDLDPEFTISTINSDQETDDEDQDTIQQRKKKNKQVNKREKYNKLKKKTTEAENKKNHSTKETTTDDYIPQQTCEVMNCPDEVFSSCHRCQILLCWEHFDNNSTCETHIQTNEETQGGHSSLFEEEQYPVEGSMREVTLIKEKRENKIKKTKKLKLTGQAYVIPKTMNLVPPKSLGPRCKGNTCEKFNKQCNIISDSSRESILMSYYNLASLQLQREFIVRHVTSEKTKQKTSGKDTSRRGKSFYYYLTVNNEKVQVCKTFFLNTMSISEKVMRTALLKVTSTGTVDKELRGGRKGHVMERDDLIREGIKKHINKFPRVESHYCRRSSTREYLSPDLNVTKMFELYLQDGSIEGPKGSIQNYRNVFRKMNLSFLRPKKDQCSLCMTYREGNEEVKHKLQDKYILHTSEKEKIRQIKNECKEESLKDKTCVTAVFDLQQVINLPITKESAVFYKRRFTVFNFTVYDVASKDCYCFKWDEVTSKRGSSEVSTCVFLYTSFCDQRGAKKINFFSDGCVGQNKNSILPSMMLYCVKNSTNITDITLRFFEPYHGQSEGDAAHSTIGRAVDVAGNIFVPSQLSSIFTLARRKQPYTVIDLTYQDFLDFKKYSQDMRILKVRKDDDGSSVNWTNMYELKVTKNEPSKIFYKTSHNQTEYKTISLQRTKRVKLTKLNDKDLPITKMKYDDLTSLCSGDTPVIRQVEHKLFYQSLPYK